MYSWSISFISELFRYLPFDISENVWISSSLITVGKTEEIPSFDKMNLIANSLMLNPFLSAIGWENEGLDAMKRDNVTAVQTVYNILEQTPGNQLISSGIKNDVGILVRVPDASGILTGKVNADTKIDEKDHRSVRKGEWIKASLKKVEQLRPIADRNGLSIKELAIKFILSKEGISSVFPTVISEEEIQTFSDMSNGKYLNNSDMKEIDQLYTKWWSENPYELKATQVA